LLEKQTSSRRLIVECAPEVIAGEYVAGLPAAEQHQQHWRTAIETLLMAAERSGIVMRAEIATRQALAHGQAEPTPGVRRKRTKSYRIIR
jgi:hypothetical protein